MARTNRARITKTFTTSGSDQDLRLTAAETQQFGMVAAYPVSVELQTVGDFALTGLDDVDVTINNVAAGKEVVSGFKVLLSTSNGSDSAMTLVAKYN